MRDQQNSTAQPLRRPSWSLTRLGRWELVDLGYRTRRANVRAWLAIRVKRGGERLSWWLQP